MVYILFKFSLFFNIQKSIIFYKAINVDILYILGLSPIQKYLIFIKKSL